MGSGRYVMAAGYKNWMEFNKGQRIHQNFMEYIMQVLVCLLVSGLYFPITSAIIGVLYLIGRVGYYWGYSKSVNARKPFVPLIMLT